MQNVITQMMKYEVGTEEGVMALLAHSILKDIDLDEDERAFFDELDFGYLYAETNIGEEEFSQMIKSFSRAKKRTLIIGNDLIAHERSCNIAKLAALIEKYSDFSLVIVPRDVNTLGVSLINSLDMDEEISGVVGYNAKGDFVISSLDGADLAIPALNQQEGTFVNIDNRVLPTNVALAFGGYNLNDIANALGITNKNTIDYTQELNKNAGFKPVAFDDLENFLSPLGEERRGYILDEVICSAEGKLEELDDMPEFNGTIIYHCDPVLQFNNYTYKTTQLPKESFLTGSAQFSVAAKISDGDIVEIGYADTKIQRVFRVDSELKGTIALNPTFDISVDASRYRFEKSKIKRVIHE
jgi:NADH-quinone oxidoreductase subunit G